MAHGVGPRYNLTQEAYTVAFNAGVGACAAYLFTLVHPIGGAVFGVVRTVTSAVVERALDKVIDDTSQGKTLKRALTFFAGVAIAWGAMALAGFPITFSAAVGLAIATIPAEFIIRCFFPAPQVARRHAPPVQQHQQLPRQPPQVNEDNPEGQIEGQPGARDAQEDQMGREINEGLRAMAFQGQPHRLGEVHGYDLG